MAKGKKKSIQKPSYKGKRAWYHELNGYGKPGEMFEVSISSDGRPLSTFEGSFYGSYRTAFHFKRSGLRCILNSIGVYLYSTNQKDLYRRLMKITDEADWYRGHTEWSKGAP